MRRLVLTLALAACNYPAGSLPPSDTGTGDTKKIDAPPGDTMMGSDAPPPPDAPPGSCDTVTCTSNGGTCVGATCDILGSNSISCPAATSCDFTCVTDTVSCRNGIECNTGSTCSISCEGDHTCDNSSSLVCASGSTCEVYCKGDHACDSLTITCAAGATCIYHCCGAHSCTMGFQCAGSGCSNGGASCP